MPLRRRDGQTIWVRDTSRAVLDADGHVMHYEGSLEDITERRRFDEERAVFSAQLQEQAQRLELILATVPEGVVLLDAAGRILQANPTAASDLMTLSHVRVGERVMRLGDRLLPELLTAPLKGGLWHEIRTEDRVFEAIAQPVEQHAEVHHWVLVLNDVTRERETREELHQQARLAAVGQLAAGIAHDFNNILAAIVLYAQMASKAPELTDHTRDRIEVINQQAWHATRLIEQVLDFSRRSVLERQSLNLVPLVKEQVQLLQRTIPEHIEVAMCCDCTDCTVNADPTRIQQVLTNLAVNARDAMPEGGTLQIELTRIEVVPGASPLVPAMEAGEWVRLRISDTGTGIAPDVLPHIFEPFFTTRAPGSGSGLGLAQVHGIVAQHGGRIGVDTVVGEGTTFTIYLPVLLADQTEETVTEPLGFARGDGKVILVVEDNVPVRTALADSLRQLGYRIRTAFNGHEALELIADHGDVDLVLSDLVMPEMGGEALFHEIRARGLNLPVVIISGHPMKQELVRLTAEGLAGWMLKPPDMEELSQMLAQALSVTPS
jgi:signal transduction histidine kinase/CheY-like chemotaxis protein